MFNAMPISIFSGALLLGLTACGDGANGPNPSEVSTTLSRPNQPVTETPRWLTETGIYEHLPTLMPTTGFIPYTPRFELFSHGANKQRLIRLPPNTSIQTDANGAWRFPVGTVAVKTFFFENIADDWLSILEA